jgi:hypothetical protein
MSTPQSEIILSRDNKRASEEEGSATCSGQATTSRALRARSTTDHGEAFSMRAAQLIMVKLFRLQFVT